MKENYKWMLLFIFIFGTAFSQGRNHLRGKVTNSMEAVVNGSIVNLSSNLRQQIL